VNDLEELLVECARHAERQVNASFFGDRAPTLGGEALIISPAAGITR
jgi:hypothetical protein